MLAMFDNNNRGWLTKLISEVVVDGDIVEDEVVEIEVAIVEFVLVGINCSDTMKNGYIKLSSNNTCETSKLRKCREE